MFVCLDWCVTLTHAKKPRLWTNILRTLHFHQDYAACIRLVCTEMLQGMLDQTHPSKTERECCAFHRAQWITIFVFIIIVVVFTAIANEGCTLFGCQRRRCRSPLAERSGAPELPWLPSPIHRDATPAPLSRLRPHLLPGMHARPRDCERLGRGAAARLQDMQGQVAHRLARERGAHQRRLGEGGCVHEACPSRRAALPQRQGRDAAGIASDQRCCRFHDHVAADRRERQGVSRRRAAELGLDV